jgi:hypothetical protein
VNRSTHPQNRQNLALIPFDEVVRPTIKNEPAAP